MEGGAWPEWMTSPIASPEHNPRPQAFLCLSPSTAKTWACPQRRNGPALCWILTSSARCISSVAMLKSYSGRLRRRRKKKAGKNDPKTSCPINGGDNKRAPGGHTSTIRQRRPGGKAPAGKGQGLGALNLLSTGCVRAKGAPKRRESVHSVTDNRDIKDVSRETKEGFQGKAGLAQG